MHILFITRGYPSTKRPQNGNFELDQARMMTKIGHTVSMISIEVGQKKFYREWGIHRIEKDGILSYNCHILPAKCFSANTLQKGINHLQLDWMYRQIVKEKGKPDVIYSHYLWNTQWGGYLKKKYHIPLVGIEHWSKMGGCIPNYLRKAAPAIYAQTDKLLTVSMGLQNNLKQILNVDSVVMNNMVAEDFVYHPHTPLPNKVRFVSCGSIIPRKGFDVLVKAFAHAQLPAERWELTIIGGGKTEELEELVRSLGVENNIHLVGRKERTEIVEILQHSDVFALASRGETFGVVYIEAMACGLPVIATICLGPETFVRKEDGVLCHVDDIEETAEKIRYMFEHHQEYNREEIAETCKKRFSADAIAHQLESILQDTIAQTRPY